jgi:hypothetical protein
MNNLYAFTVSALPRQLRQYWRELKFTLAALEIGSRAVGLADNRQLVRDLAARAASLYPNN